ncbi:MAG: hypothetical protein ISS34_03000 [Candidatus Omnitrophica bacterium]|nr:hypothetical protein [Candidatus Omnitrophota bacterium]
MIRSVIMFCAEGVVQDAQTNNISAFNIFQRLASPAFPLFIQKFYVFNLLEREDSDPAIIDCRIVITNNEIELFSFPARIDFRNSNLTRSIGTIVGLSITNPGTLTFTFYMGSTSLASYIIKVDNTNPPQGTIENTNP